MLKIKLQKIKLKMEKEFKYMLVTLTSKQAGEQKKWLLELDRPLLLSIVKDWLQMDTPYKVTVCDLRKKKSIKRAEALYETITFRHLVHAVRATTFLCYKDEVTYTPTTVLVKKFYMKPFTCERSLFNGQWYTFFHECVLTLEGLEKVFLFVKRAFSGYFFTLGQYYVEQEYNDAGERYYALYEHKIVEERKSVQQVATL